jgi:Fur family transcriptional regulator, ferric uptake regulator
LTKDPIPRAIREALARHGTYLTKPRREILRVLLEQTRPQTALEIWRSVETSGIDRSTVYRNLQYLKGLDIVVSILLEDGLVRFEPAEPYLPHHHHLICVQCGAITVLRECPVESIYNEIEVQTGFVPYRHQLEFYGLCEKCNEDRST